MIDERREGSRAIICDDWEFHVWKKGQERKDSRDLNTNCRERKEQSPHKIPTHDAPESGRELTVKELREIFIRAKEITNHPNQCRSEHCENLHRPGLLEFQKLFDQIALCVFF